MALGAATAGSRGRRSRRQTFAEINITPLTDVVLVLLIIFMATAQFMEQSEHGLGVNLPSASEVDDLNSLGGLRVSIDRDGVISLDGTPVLPEELPSQLLATKQSNDQLVIVEGDRETVLQHVVTVMDAAAGAGLPNVVLATALEQGAPLPAAADAADLPAGEPPGTAAPPAAGNSPFLTPPPVATD